MSKLGDERMGPVFDMKLPILLLTIERRPSADPLSRKCKEKNGSPSCSRIETPESFLGKDPVTFYDNNLK